MKAINHFDENTARKVGERLQVEFNLFDLTEFQEALNLELDGELKEGEIKPNDELTDQDLEGIGRLAFVHINPYMD